MKYQIQKHSGEAAYLQLCRQLREDIVSGLLPLGAKLPSKRSFAEELGVSVITVDPQRLLRQLRRGARPAAAPGQAGGHERPGGGPAGLPLLPLGQDHARRPLGL